MQPDESFGSNSLMQPPVAVVKSTLPLLVEPGVTRRGERSPGRGRRGLIKAALSPYPAGDAGGRFTFDASTGGGGREDAHGDLERTLPGAVGKETALMELGVREERKRAGRPGYVDSGSGSGSGLGPKSGSGTSSGSQGVPHVTRSIGGGTSSGSRSRHSSGAPGLPTLQDQSEASPAADRAGGRTFPFPSGGSRGMDGVSLRSADATGSGMYALEPTG